MTEPIEPVDSAESIVAAIRELGRTVHAREIDPADRVAVLRHLDAALDLLVDAAPRRRRRARDRDLSAFCGALNPVAPPMMIRAGELADGRPALFGSVRLDRLREGPPNAAHGGVLAGLFDELLGGGPRLDGGRPAMTGRLTVRYRRPTPLNADLELRAWVHDERTRRVVVRGECVVLDDSGDAGSPPVTAEAEAIFLRVDFGRLELGS